MRTLKLFAAAVFLLACSQIQAQVSVNVNIGTAPTWGPAGYSDVEYYYLPDVESYYDIRRERFIYYDNGAWVHRRYLPARYRHYDLYNGYKVVLTDYHGPSPYVDYKVHKVKYYRGYHGAPQHTIGVRPVVVEHVYVKGHHDNGKHKGHYKGHGEGKGHGKGKH